MSKKLFAVLSTIVMFALLLTACGTTAATTTAAATTAAVTTAAGATTAAETTAAETTAAGKLIKVGITVPTFGNPVFARWTSDAKTYGEANGCSVQIEECQSNLNTQINQIENYITEKMDAIVILAFDPKGIEPVVAKAKAAGIKIIAHTMSIVGQDVHLGIRERQDLGFAIGKEAADWINAKLGGKADVAFLTLPTVVDGVDREAGMQDAINQIAPAAKIVARQMAIVPADGMKVTEAFLAAHPNIKVISCINDGGALGAYQAVKAAGKATDDFFINGCDGTKEGLTAIKEGGIYRGTFDLGTVDFGKMVIDIAKNLISGAPQEKEIQFPITLVTIDNVDKYLALYK